MGQSIPEWTCNRCGTFNRANSRYCANCGTPYGTPIYAPTQQGGPAFGNPSQQVIPPPVSRIQPPATEYYPQPNPYTPAPPDPYIPYPGSAPPPPPGETTIKPPENPYDKYEKPPTRFSRRGLLIGGGIAALAAGTGIYFIVRSKSGGNTIPITIVHSTEKSAWLNAALNVFKQSKNNTLNNKTIQVTLTGLGSVDSLSQILSGQIKPHAWSPASNLEMSRLNFKWQQAHNGSAIISTTQQLEPQSLVKSPLVLLSWAERAQKLLAHYHVDTLDWPVLSQALQANSWAQLGGVQNWGRVKFGQTVPEKSNSGLLTVTLLAYQYFNEPRSLTVDQFAASSKYWDYIDVFEQAVNRFGCSSGTYLRDVLGAGPAQADIIATYENLALTSQPASGDLLPAYYPAINILSDHPYAVLQGDWATDEQTQAALQFRDFLLAQDQQVLALGFGFRPGAANSPLTLDTNVPGMDNPFKRYAGIFPHHLPDPVQSLANEPGGQVVDALITGWNQKYNGSYTTLDC